VVLSTMHLAFGLNLDPKLSPTRCLKKSPKQLSEILTAGYFTTLRLGRFGFCGDGGSVSSVGVEITPSSLAG
jgi:hypothetical protein